MARYMINNRVLMYVYWVKYSDLRLVRDEYWRQMRVIRCAVRVISSRLRYVWYGVWRLYYCIERLKAISWYRNLKLVEYPCNWYFIGWFKKRKSCSRLTDDYFVAHCVCIQGVPWVRLENSGARCRHQNEKKRSYKHMSESCSVLRSRPRQHWTSRRRPVLV